MKKYKKIYLLLLILFIMSCQNRDILADASGAFEAVEVIISSEAAGKILELNIEEGERVEEGMVLGSIDSVQLKLKKEQLLASADSINSKRVNIEIQTAPLKQQIEAAKKEKSRIENLIGSGAVNTKQMDDISAQLKTLEKQLEAQIITFQNGNKGIESELIAMNSQMAQLEDQIQKATIISPISGTILVKYVEKGELAYGGKPLFKIADLQQMYLRAYVTSGQLSSVRLTQSVTILSEWGEGDYKSIEGKITWISDKAEFTPKTVQTRSERDNLTYAVKVAVPNDGYLKIGMYGGIQFGE